MKWIGQHIYDNISRFRDDVYLEDISTSTETSMLVVDSSGKISKRAMDALDIDVSDFMTNGADNRVLTATGADAMNAEASLTFDGSILSVTGVADISPANDAGAAALTIDNDDTDQIALDINASNIDASIIDIDATALVSGPGVVFIDSANARNEFVIDRDCTATGNQSHGGMIELEGTKASITGSGSTHDMVGMKSTITDTATNVGTSNLVNLVLNSNMTSAGGTTKLHGISNTIIGASDDTVGLYSNVVNGSPDIKLVSSADATDYFTIATGEDGETTFTTFENGGGSTAHLNFIADGNVDIEGKTITLDAAVAIELENATNVTGDLTVSGKLVMGSTDALTNAGLLSVANQTGITGVGTISSGTWQGTAVASAYLDADTAHLSGTQTFGGAKTFSSAIVGQTTVQKWIKNVAYVATQGTTETFIPMVGSAENTSIGNGSMGIIMPTAGKLLKVHLKTQRDHSGVTTTVTMYNLDIDEAHTAGNFTSLGVQSATGPATGAVGVFDFQSSLDSGTNAFTAGELLAISITNSGAVSSSCKYFVTLVFELDWASY